LLSLGGDIPTSAALVGSLNLLSLGGGISTSALVGIPDNACVALGGGTIQLPNFDRTHISYVVPVSRMFTYPG
jgi:hypothetical protein